MSKGGFELALPSNFEGGDPLAKRDALPELVRPMRRRG